jgi:prepilin-type processing-associated H-X9-DG protein
MRVGERVTSERFSPPILNRHRGPAFTIVELLVVIGIIAVLVCLLVPTLSSSREKANQAKCMANLRSIGQALTEYAQNNGGYLPWGFYHTSDTDLAQVTDWTNLLLQEVSGLRVADYAGVIKAGDETKRAIFQCPDAPTQTVQSALLCDYSCHPRIMPDSGTANLITGDLSSFLHPYKISQIQHSSEIALIFDASVKANEGRWTSSVCAFSIDDGRLYRGTFLTDQYSIDISDPGIGPGDPISLMPNPSKDVLATNTDQDNNWGNIRFRHMKNQQANVLMVDGHVENFSLSTSLVPNLCRRNVGVNISPN